MNHLSTGSSGARITYGRAVTPFETSSGINHTATESSIKPENQSSTTTTQQNSTSHETLSPSTESNFHQNTATVTPSYSTIDMERYRVKSISSSTLSPVTSDEGRSSTFEYVSTTPTPTNEDILRDTVYNQPQTIDTIAPIILAHPTSDDTYLQPEINEISNGFVGNIVSMLPGIIATRTKLLKPIIVSNSSNTKREITSGDNVTKEIDARPDQAVESAQPEEYHELPDEQVISAGNETDALDESQAKYLGVSHAEVDIKKPHVDVVIEPQMLEEQAVITTTVDIAKSLPLAVNFVPENDNHLNDIPVNYVPTSQPHVVLPQHNVYLQPPVAQPLVALQLPQAVLKPDHIHQPYLLPNSEFHYIPIPVLQHQPNLIPLNYANDNRNSSDIHESLYNDGIRSPPEQHQAQEHPQRNEYSFVKSIEDYSSNQYNNKPYENHRKPHNKPQYLQQQLDQRRPSIPYTTINLPAAQLVPYVKHNFLQQPPGHHPGHQPKYPPPSASPKSHNVPYNVQKAYPKEKRAPQQKAPFKPSHPVWDSVYPPSHMYYVPLYVFDRVPGERNPKDSFSRKHQHLRRLYVEYGGFKPPLVPSTLIETEEPAQEKRDVPKEAGTES
ncbi:hypothetical protein U1Q18_049877 [Sarracenia purpurea var. burkii]